MSLSIADQERGQATQKLGSQFEAFEAIQAPFRVQEMNQDLDHIMAANETDNEEASSNPLSAPSRFEKQESDFIDISRCTGDSRKNHITSIVGDHTNQHEASFTKSDPTQRWSSQHTLEEPWINIGQVGVCIGQSMPKTAVGPSKVSSAAAVKGSLDADEVR
jgi:hypothetical protein